MASTLKDTTEARIIAAQVADPDGSRRLAHSERIMRLNGHAETADFLKQLLDHGVRHRTACGADDPAPAKWINLLDYAITLGGEQA